MLGFYPAGKTPHLIKRCEVRQMDAVWLTVTEATDFLEHLFPAVGIAPVQENRRPARRKIAGDQPPVPVGRAGDENDLLVDGTHQSPLRS
jgi:hypothetical protein